MYLNEIGINTRIWVDLAQDVDYWRTLVNAALNFRTPKAMGLISYIKWYVIKHEWPRFLSVPGTSINFYCGLGLERGPPSLVRTIG